MNRPSELPKGTEGLSDAKSQILDRLASSPTNYWGGFVTDPITAVLFFTWETFILERSVYISLGVYFGAIFFVSLIEYLLHRYIFHGPRQNMAQAGHLMHHGEPKALIGTPWLLTQAMWWSIACVAVFVLRIPYALSFMAAFITGYVGYAIVHHHIHHHSRLRWFKQLQIHHNIHHRIPTVNYGVTSPLWDMVFGTRHQARKLSHS
jgi:sterol desaturase/sphingolipid hydroxylase (fatty acid hydroxylase superfamily)